MKWIKPNGAEVETNDRPGSIEAAEAAGWKPKGKSPKENPAASGAVTTETVKK